MNIVEVPIGELKPAEYNPREMPPAMMEKLIRSIEEFGFVQPIVVRSEDKLVVGGHQRLEAMQIKLRRDEVPEEEIAKQTVPVVFLTGVSDERAKLLNVALNKISGDWDDDKLAALFSSLAPETEVDLPVADLGLTGFFPDEIDKLLADVASSQDTGGKHPKPGVPAPASTVRYTFDVPAGNVADVCQQALERYGMSKRQDAARAFERMARAALKAAAPVKKKKRRAAA